MKTKVEEVQEIVVLDSGIERESLVGPLGPCCLGSMFPWRG
jgi:hypothetical protein